MQLQHEQRRDYHDLGIKTFFVSYSPILFFFLSSTSLIEISFLQTLPWPLPYWSLLRENESSDCILLERLLRQNKPGDSKQVTGQSFINIQEKQTLWKTLMLIEFTDMLSKNKVFPAESSCRDYMAFCFNEVTLLTNGIWC